VHNAATLADTRISPVAPTIKDPGSPTPRRRRIP
jgi:hypothetical protein